jgi:hypothetical protein|tara:strand:+ start:262 stop:693 length:432 start_codon:yes stop_codon:yes gene_type:complete
MRIHKEIIIDAPVKEVWNVFSEVEEWPALCSNIVKIYWTSREKWSLNSTFTQIVKNITPLRIISHTKVIKIMPYKSVTWTGTRSLIKGIHTFKFEKINKKTKVTNIEYFKGPLAPIIFPFIKNKFEIYFERFLNGLKRKVEKQ